MYPFHQILSISRKNSQLQMKFYQHERRERLNFKWKFANLIEKVLLSKEKFPISSENFAITYENGVGSIDFETEIIFFCKINNWCELFSSFSNINTNILISASSGQIILVKPYNIPTNFVSKYLENMNNPTKIGKFHWNQYVRNRSVHSICGIQCY